MPGAPLVKPIKAPLGTSAPTLVQPVQPKIVRKPLQPVKSLVESTATPQLDDVPLPASQITEVVEEAPVAVPTEELEAAVAEEIESIEPVVEPAVREETNVEDEAPVETAMMRPITAVLSPVGAVKPVATTTLKPVLPQLTPKKPRGAPPNISRGASAEKAKTPTATLTPVRTLTPLNVKSVSKDEDEEEQDEA